MFGYTPFPAIEGQPYNLTLSPYAFLWFQLQKQRVQTEEAADVAGCRTGGRRSWKHPGAGRGPGRDAQSGAWQAERRSGPAAAPGACSAWTSCANWRRWWHLSRGRIRRCGLRWPFRSRPPSPAGHEHPEAIKLELTQAVKAVAPTLSLAPYTQPANTLQESWPHPARTYAEVGRLAAEHNATAVMLLGQDAGSLNPEAIPALVQAILTGWLRSGGAALPGRTI